MAPKGIELFSRPRFGFTSSSFVYQRDRLPLSYKLHKFFLPKLTHVVVVSFIVVVVYMQSDSLKEDRMLFWIFMALHSMTMTFFFIASCMNPGYVTRESVKLFMDTLTSPTPEESPNHNSETSSDFRTRIERDEETTESSEDEVFLHSQGDGDFYKKPLIASSQHNTGSGGGGAPKLSYKDKPVVFRKCNYCELVQPLRAKHCEECGRCVRKYDHHCPWLGSCVGESNHRFFWALLSTGFITTTLTLHLTYQAFHTPSSFSVSDYLKLNILLIVVFILETLFVLVDTVLLCAHTYLMISNQTSWEFMARSRITYLRELAEDENPFDRGLLHNCWQFLCSCSSGAKHWELYFTNLSQSAQSCVSSVIQGATNSTAAASSSSGATTSSNTTLSAALGRNKQQYSKLRTHSNNDEFTIGGDDTDEDNKWNPINLSQEQIIERCDFDDDDSLFISRQKPTQSVSLLAVNIEHEETVGRTDENLVVGSREEIEDRLSDITVEDSGNGESFSSTTNLAFNHV